MITISLGNVGCLTGDTIINVNRCKKGGTYRLDYMHTMFHNTYKDKSKQWDVSKTTYVRSYDGTRIRLHPIRDVVYSGKKTVYLIELENGLQIKATASHPIMTQGCMFKRIDELSIKDFVMIDTLKPQRGNKKSYKMRDIQLTGGFHPYKNKNGCVEVHRLIFEAHDNTMHLSDFLDVLWNDEDQSKKLRFVNPHEYEIHHTDRNHYNNCITNLSKLTKRKHKQLHGDVLENFSNFNQSIPKFSRVKSITKQGIEKTYDIVCDEPLHNFVANGMVVHNSGKSAGMVKDLKTNPSRRVTYSNIITKGIPNNIVLSHDMIIKKELIKVKKNGEEEYKLTFNKEFWVDAVKKHGAINVILDEAHFLFDSRSSMSQKNKVMGSFLALLRRILGSADDGYGELTLITQLASRIDTIARQMATKVIYSVCHYEKTCKKCGYTWNEHNEMSERVWDCARCGSHAILKHNHVIQRWYFRNMRDYDAFNDFGMKSFYKQEYIPDIEDYFKNFDTLQWDNLIFDE